MNTQDSLPVRMDTAALRGVVPTFIVALACLTPLLVGIAAAIAGSAPWLGSAIGPMLHGFTDKTPFLQFGWFERRFQTSFSGVVDERLPLRNWMIQVNNQLDYSLLKTSRMYRGTIVISKDGVLNLRNPVAQSLGHTPDMPDTTMREVAQRLKRLHDLLAQRGIPLVILGTPTKVSFARDSVPAAFREYRPGAPRNYERLTAALRDAGVPFTDGRAEMRRSGLQSQAPLFPKGGSHWTQLGVYAATRHALAGLFPEARPQELRLVLDDVVVTRKAAGTDADLLMLLNLLLPDVSYGSVQIKTHLEGAPPLAKTVLLIGSSYTGQLQTLLLQAGIAPRVVRYEYMQFAAACEGCAPESLPANWPELILGETSAVILELNENSFFVTYGVPGRQYVQPFLDRLMPALERDRQQLR
jgi:hypothetical protein